MPCELKTSLKMFCLVLFLNVKCYRATSERHNNQKTVIMKSINKFSSTNIISRMGYIEVSNHKFSISHIYLAAFATLKTVHLELVVKPIKALNF